MISISGFDIKEQLYISEQSLICRALRQSDQQSFILKLLNIDYPSPGQTARFKREYEMTRFLETSQHQEIIKVHGLDSHNSSQMMIVEDFGAESLKSVLAAGHVSLQQFLEWAVVMTDTLAKIHQQNIMHKDVNPSNFVWNANTGTLKIIDFGIATKLSQEHPEVLSPNVLEGTLAYMSPEQTGRMNRSVDYRTDLYSLGVSFYQMLTGHLPFEVSDTMELIHCHLAKRPVPPHQMKPHAPITKIPQTLSEIIIRLMRKSPENRYQTASGLKVDLQRCLEEWKTEGNITPFEIGQHDVSDRFHPPQKLYGREREMRLLMETFASVKRGNTEVMLVSGYSGIGKSLLIHEIHKPIAAQRGYFISGKFDQLQRNIPYSALILAFQDLSRQLLTETEEQLHLWKEKLLESLGNYGQIIIDVIPEIEWIIGPQPPVPELNSQDSQNRFNRIFQLFLQTFTQREHPLVIFLDDLQWADLATLNLFKVLMRNQDEQFLFLIGAFRNNEISEGHPFMTLVKETKRHLKLLPLEVQHIQQLIAETLNCRFETAYPLAEQTFQRTGGNPFFVNEFLKTLYDEALIQFDRTQGIWKWDFAGIQKRGITDNVVELMSDKILKLPLPTQEVLKYAACVGSRFNLETLSVVTEKDIGQISKNLWKATQTGLVISIGKTHIFSHDRVQQAAYSLIPSNEEQAIHLQIGRLLLKTIEPHKHESQIFEVVNQLNLGKTLIECPEEKEQLARLNLLAGKKAHTSTAHEPAYRYLNTGLMLLKDDCWQSQYTLTFDLHEEAALVAHHLGHHRKTERWLEIMLEQSRQRYDQIKVYEIMIRSYIWQDRLSEAVKTALIASKLLGIQFPKNPQQSDLKQAFLDIQQSLAGRSIEALGNQPEMTSRAALSAIRILSYVSFAISMTNPELYVLNICQRVSLSIAHGNAPSSAYAYAAYGATLCALGDNIETGYRYGQLALRLLDQSPDNEFRIKTLYMAHLFTRHWKEPLRQSIQPLVGAFQKGLEIGDILYASVSIFDYCLALFIAGNNLHELEPRMGIYAKTIDKLQQRDVLHLHQNTWQLMLNLMGKECTTYPYCLTGETFDEREMIPLFEENQEEHGLFHYYFTKFILCYFFEVHDQAYDNADRAEHYLNMESHVFMALPAVAAFHFYDSLVRLANYAQSNESTQTAILQKVHKNQERMEQWAQQAPMNYLHRFYLVEAERLRVLNQDNPLQFYEQAIELAHKNKFIHEEGLAYELTAKYCLGMGEKSSAQIHLLEARHRYFQWGARAKVKQLNKVYPQLLPEQTERAHGFGTIVSNHSESLDNPSEFWDLTTAMKASQAISEEVEQQSLLDKMLDMVVENVGAQTGILLLKEAGEWKPHANTSASFPQSLVHYVARTKESIVLSNASQEERFLNKPYFLQASILSVLCHPLLHRGKLSGILYLENNLIPGAFTVERLEILKLLSSQTAIAIENAKLYNSLEEREEQYRSLVENINVGIYRRSGATHGKYLQTNAAMLRILGFESAAELEHQDIPSLYIHPHKRQDILEQFYNDGGCKNLELYLRKKDGTPIWVNITATVEFDELRQIKWVDGVIEDITERKEAEQVLKRYNQKLEQEVAERTEELQQALAQIEKEHATLKQTQVQLVQAEKMAGLGTMVAGVAHEINNPINFIYGNALNLKESLSEFRNFIFSLMDADAEEEEIKIFEKRFDRFFMNLGAITNGSSRLKTIVTDLRTFSRLGESEQKLSYAVEGLKSTFRLIETQYGNAIDFVCDFQANPQLNCWPAQLNQVFMNMMVNACEAIHYKQTITGDKTSGELKICTFLWDDEPPMPTPQSSAFAIRFQDTGCGMSQEVQQKMFEPFFTTKSAGEGTGLGLSIAYGIIEKHGGHIMVDSTIDVGSTITLLLPLEEGVVTD